MKAHQSILEEKEEVLQRTQHIKLANFEANKQILKIYNISEYLSFALKSQKTRKLNYHNNRLMELNISFIIPTKVCWNQNHWPNNFIIN